MQFQRPIRHRTIWTDSSTAGNYRKYVWKLRKVPKENEDEVILNRKEAKRVSLLKKELETPQLFSVTNHKKPRSRKSTRLPPLYIYPPPPTGVFTTEPTYCCPLSWCICTRNFFTIIAV